MARVESDNTQLNSTVLLLKDDNTQLKIDNARLLTDLSEVHDDLRILHPLPYARLHFQKCINHQIACNDAVNAFIDQHTLKVINVTPSLSSSITRAEERVEEGLGCSFCCISSL
jgi:hypothetical protein